MAFFVSDTNISKSWFTDNLQCRRKPHSCWFTYNFKLNFGYKQIQKFPMISRKCLYSVSSCSLPDPVITLKKVFIVMMSGNINTTGTNCDVTKHIVHNMTPSHFSLTVETEKLKGKKLLLPGISYKPKSGDLLLPWFPILQLPSCISFVASSRKEQGQ